MNEEPMSSIPTWELNMLRKNDARWMHARWHAMGKLLEAYPTCDTCDVGLDYAVDCAIAKDPTAGTGICHD